MKRAPSSEVPDTVLPVQFFTQTAWSDTPERRLMFAVLMDAILELQGGDPQAVVDAERWIRDETEHVPISFTEACDFLGIEAPGFARGLLSWHAQAGLVRDPRPRGRHRVTPPGRLRVRDADAAAVACHSPSASA